MSTSKSTMRSLLTVITLAALTTMVSGLTLAIHLSANHTEHQHCCNEKHTQNEPTGKPEHQKQQHDHHSCPTCQVLLGSTGKYYCETIAEISITLAQSNFAHQYISTFTGQHRPISAVPRGPPAAYF